MSRLCNGPVIATGPLRRWAVCGKADIFVAPATPVESFPPGRLACANESAERARDRGAHATNGPGRTRAAIRGGSCRAADLFGLHRCRDRPALLVKSINSVLAGSLGDFEIIVVDDGYATPTETSLTEAGLLPDERIHVLRQEPAGIATARNAALRAATGRYVTVLDSDDELAPDGLASLAGFIESTGATWVYTDYEEVVNGSGSRITLPAYGDAEQMRKAVLSRPRCLKHSGMTIDRELLVSLGGMTS